MAQDDFDLETLKEGWNGIKSKVKWGLAALVGLNIAWTSWYIVPTGHEAVIKTLGAYERTEGEGLCFKLPLFIQDIEKVDVKTVTSECFGFRSLEPGVDSKYLGEKEIAEGKAGASDLENLVRTSGARVVSSDLASQATGILQDEYLMLTGDLNMADVEWVVQYQISDPRAYMFNVKDPIHTLRDASLATMKRIMGNSSVDEATTIGRIENANMAEEELQQLMNSYGTGLNIVTVKLQSTHPPKAVRDAFNNVNLAQQEKEKRINEANKAYNEVVPKAVGEAEQTIKDAQGYAIKVVNEAQGDSSKFMEQWAAYRRAPAITRERIYLEAMEKVLPNAGEVIIIDDKGLGNGVLNILGMEGKK